MTEHATSNPSPNIDSVIKADGLTKTFKQFVAVDNVSLSVRRGEIFGLLGPNGAGKTTTIRMLLGLIRPSSGVATVLGYDTSRQAGELRRHIGYMSQRFSLYDDLTVEQNLAFFGGMYGVRGRHMEQRRAYVLEMADLAGREGERTANLSGGWRQRLALGCAILHEPQVLFLDEPTAGVDPVARRLFWDLLYTLSDRGHTVLVTTHYMDEAEQCHRLAFIQRGKLVAMGTPEEIKREQMPDQVIEIDCAAPDRAMAALRASGAFVEVSLYGAQIHVIVHDAHEGRRQVKAILEGAGIPVHDIQVIAPSLEDVFITSAREHRYTDRGSR
jgi:ABC-2 type transport system ATP-binding protein